MMRAYPGNPSVAAGGALRLHVGGAGKQFRVRFVRAGAKHETVPSPQHPVRSLDEAGSGGPGTPWVWTAHEFALPASWRPGAYVAELVRPDGHDDGLRRDPSRLTNDARSARALIAVRSDEQPGDLLVVLPLFTYHAYNVAAFDGTAGAGEGDCLYSGAKWVTIERPGGGTGGHPWDEVNVDAYDVATPRQTFAHWDAKAIAWLEREGYRYDVCTDLDLHEARVDLAAYRAVVSFGHHEYWTDRMRTNVERFVEDGGNVAFFGGNTMWFRLEWDPIRRAISRAGRWNEWETTGVSYARGGGRWIGARPRADFRLVDEEHWIVEGLGLARGASFGGDASLAGYECDGRHPDSDLETIARADLSRWPERDASGERAPDGHADVGLRRHGKGRIFTASTVDWARVLQAGDPVVEGVTRNVLRRFTSSATSD
jgi:hypothetical protein